MLYKRSRKPGAHWWVRFYVKNVEIRQSSGTDRKELAEAFEQSLREAIWREQNLGQEIHTWSDAVDRWLKEKAHKRSLERDRQSIRRLGISGDTELSMVTPATAKPAGARELAVLRSILRAASTKWNWLDKAPPIELPHVEKHEPRWITKEQFDALHNELPPHAQAIASFAVYTGLRSRNILELKWDACDLGKGICRVAARKSKSGRPIGIPLSGRAVAVLRGQVGRHPEYVFPDDEGQAPIGSIKTCWRKAVARAGLGSLRFHDLRHTWAAWHTLAGTPPIVLKELGGWSSLAMVERYAHLNPAHLADWADNSRTKAGTSKKRQKRKRLK